MDGARVVVIEDRERNRIEAKKSLETNGHSVVGEAATLIEALSLVDTIGTGELEADVILLDGNLEPDSDLGGDARTIASRIKENGITSRIIGFSSLPMRHYSVEVDADSGKDMNEVIEAIATF